MLRFRRVAPLLAVIVAVAVQFAPVLAGRVYRFEDIADYFEPLWTAAARAMQSGRWPLWDGGAWSGQPIAGDPQLGAFYPPNWLWCALPVLRAYAVCAAGHALLGGLGMYTLARVRGASREAAALAGVALGTGGYVVLQVRHIMFVEATAWLPWVVAAGWRLVETRRRAHLAALALATGMMLLTGGVSMIYYGAWFAAAVLLPHALAGDVALQQRAHRVADLALGAALGVLIAAPSIVPAVEHGRLSPRALGVDEAFASSVAWGGLRFLPSLLVPNLLGQQVRGDYRGGGTQWEIAGYYTGMLTVALGLIAIARGPRCRRTERFTLAAVMAACVLLAPGSASPLHHLACRLLPYYGAMRCPPRALYVVALAVPMLAADGLDLLRARLAARPMLQRTIHAAAPLLVALDLLVTHRAENPTRTLGEAHREAFPAAVSYLRAQLGEGDRYINDVHLRHDLHNSGLLWGLPNASGYSSLPLWRYVHLLWIANHGKVYPHPRLHDDLSAQGIWRMGSPILDALAVRWVLSPVPPNGTGFVRRAEDGSGFDVWENTEALPRAWLVERARAVGSEGEAAQAVAAGFDPAREAIVEAAQAPATGRGRVDVVRASLYGHVELFAHLETPGLLIVSEPYHSGWRATIDDQPVALLAADLALLALPVPAGDHAVRLEMRPGATRIGAGLGAAAILCVAAIALVDLRRRRNRNARRPALDGQPGARPLPPAS